MDNDSISRYLACHTEPTLALPASDADVMAQVIHPALELLPARMTSTPARVLLLAIGRQESGYAHRAQVGGPAHGLWQFEMGGVQAVMRDRLTAVDCGDLCAEREVRFSPRVIYDALAIDDVLAAGIARLLLWSDDAPLPAPGDEAGAWAYYLRNWRPGKPGPDRWHACYQAALAVVRGES